MVRVEVRTMNYLSGFGRRGCFVLKPAQSAAILLSVVSAGCSADVARFDSNSFKLNDPKETVAAAPPPAAPVRSGTDYNNPVTRSQPRGPYGAGAPRAVEVAALPDATPSLAAPSYQSQPASPKGWHTSPTGAPLTTAAAVPAPPAAIQTGGISRGQSIDVQPGDTLYGLSKRHHVSVSELMSVNQLTSPNLKPGQKLVLPAGNSSHKPLRRPVEAAVKTMAPPAADVAAKYNSTYTVKPGDSLYTVARANKVPYAELQQVNGITDPRKVRPGTVLKMPAGLGGAVAAAEPAPAVAPVAPTAAPVTEAPRAIQSTTQPTSIINGGKQVAALHDKASDAAPAAPVASPKAAAAAPQAASQATDSSKLRWPVNGKVIAGFGGRPDGTHNDGVNLSVPLGTEVHAAENGIVAYAGSELKGYGNLVLVRHDNGWVTAYAHNDELMVKRGDKVARGQVIGKAGKTGTVDQPQVHFELRQGSKPVDPTPYMEKI